MTRKVFFSYDEQISKLQEKGLVINDIEFAKDTLQKISYYSLIGGYKDLFKHLPSGNYTYGVTFEEITSFYYFDEDLRLLFLKYILHIERQLKSMISYYFCEKYGEAQSEYLNPQNYNLTRRNHNQINRLINALNSSITLPSRYSYISHNAICYNNVPLWVAMNALTFGVVSKMYQYATTDIRSLISHNYANISEVQLHQFISVLASCRNTCAHNERLYSFRVNESIPNTLLHLKLNIPIRRGQYLMGKNDLFSVVIAFRFLLDEKEFKTFKRQLKKLIDNILLSCPHLRKNDLYRRMGFPENWSKITRYKIY